MRQVHPQSRVVRVEPVGLCFTDLFQLAQDALVRRIEDSLVQARHGVTLLQAQSVDQGRGKARASADVLLQMGKKIKALRMLASGRNDGLLIEVDGGVGNNNALTLLQAGADVLVAGNAVFAASDPADAISELKNISSALHNA